MRAKLKGVILKIDEKPYNNALILVISIEHNSFKNLLLGM